MKSQIGLLEDRLNYICFEICAYQLLLHVCFNFITNLSTTPLHLFLVKVCFLKNYERHSSVSCFSPLQMIPLLSCDYSSKNLFLAETAVARLRARPNLACVHVYLKFKIFVEFLQQHNIPIHCFKNAHVQYDKK